MMIVYWGIEYFATWIETLLCLKFSNEFIEKKNRVNIRWKIIIYAMISSLLVLVVNNIKLFSLANGIMGIIILFILQSIIFRKRYSLIFLLTMLYAVIVSALDFSIAQMGAIVLHVNTDYILETQSIERCQCMVVSKLLLFIIVYFFIKYSQNEMELPTKYIAGNCMIAIILINLDYFIIKKCALTEDEEMRRFSIIFFILSIAIIILIFGFVLKLSENYKQKQDMELLELQNEMIYKAGKNTERAFNMWRSSIHDYKHKIIAIKRWLDEGNIEEVKKFVNEENMMLEQKIFYIKTGNDIVDAIVNTKQNIAEEKGILFSINIALPEKCVISDLDMVCLLGNLIDNAIEACEKQKRKYIDVVIRDVKKMLIIKVSNSYDSKIPINFITSKEKKIMHGIGLKNVKSIVNKYLGTYELVKEKNEVITTIMLLNK